MKTIEGSRSTKCFPRLQRLGSFVNAVHDRSRSGKGRLPPWQLFEVACEGVTSVRTTGTRAAGDADVQKPAEDNGVYADYMAGHKFEWVLPLSATSASLNL